MSLFVAHTLPKFQTWAKLVVWYLPHFPPARRATTACRFSCISQCAALILFKICLISEAQPHSSSSHPISSFPNLLIFFLPVWLTLPVRIAPHFPIF
ncbi:hypothetical protein HMPREF9078_00295 [Capnocytophaga sp. oral taxon 380 str. F0488]|nr:hypothetical protein HMPREF9078_00295 [Capnocytophaga sp. oral taxon 380 str. F0488]